jgi:hypothetical protein
VKVDNVAENKWIASQIPKSIIISFMLDFVDATYQIAIIYKAYNAPFLK